MHDSSLSPRLCPWQHLDSCACKHDIGWCKRVRGEKSHSYQITKKSSLKYFPSTLSSHRPKRRALPIQSIARKLCLKSWSLPLQKASPCVQLNKLRAWRNVIFHILLHQNQRKIVLLQSVIYYWEPPASGRVYWVFWDGVRKNIPSFLIIHDVLSNTSWESALPKWGRLCVRFHSL